MSGARRRFRFIKEIAEGGFGKVYLAEQLSQDGFSRIVALKLLHQKWSSHDEVVMRTRDEARLLGLIRHQHIVRVEDLTSVDGKLAIVMEYLEGVDLKGIMAYLRERDMIFPRQALFEIMISVASALDAAYNGEPLQGGEPLRVIHRDIKPSNIFVTINGGLKVLDFGTARANFEAREAKTQALAFGSQGYMAPERMLGEEDTPAADVFSLGVTLQELLSLDGFGRIPPRPNKFVAKIDEKVSSTPLEGDPEWVDQVRETLRLMMAYEPSERPSARQLVDIFEILAQGAGDMGMRRFCRSIVAESKAAMPDLDTGDPLAGTIIEEDPSSVWGIDDASSPDSFEGSPADVPEPAGVASPPPPPAPAPTPVPLPAQRQSTPVAGRAVSLPEEPLPPPPDEEDLDEPAKKGGALRLMLIATVVVVVLGLLGAGIAVAVVVAVFLVPGDSLDAPAPAPEVVEVAEEPTLDLPDGGKVLSQDRRGDEAPRSKKTVLSLNGDEAALVAIIGSLGFKAEWDGRDPFDLGELPAGKYRANVTPLSTGEKIRNTKFEIEKGKSCELAFDVASKKWSGGCK